jgi:hypothetical protein
MSRKIMTTPDVSCTSRKGTALTPKWCCSRTDNRATSRSLLSPVLRTEGYPISSNSPHAKPADHFADRSRDRSKTTSEMRDSHSG